MDRATVSLGLTAIFIAVQLPLGFGIIHLFLQKNAAGSLCWHMPLCAFCVAFERIPIEDCSVSTVFGDFLAPLVLCLGMHNVGPDLSQPHNSERLGSEH